MATKRRLGSAILHVQADGGEQANLIASMCFRRFLLRDKETPPADSEALTCHVFIFVFTKGCAYDAVIDLNGLSWRSWLAVK